MTVTVKIPTPLRPVTGGLGEIKIDATTVGDVLRRLVDRVHPVRTCVRSVPW